MINKAILRLWILDNIKTLQFKTELIDNTIDMEFITPEKSEELKIETHRIYGRMEMLKELYDQFNIEQISEDEEIIYHNQI